MSTDGTAVPLESRLGLRAEAVWRRTFELADRFDQHDDAFAVLFDILRTARHETGTLTGALVLGRRFVRAHPRDLVARRACLLLERAIRFMGGDGSIGHAGRPRHHIAKPA